MSRTWTDLALLEARTDHLRTALTSHGRYIHQRTCGCCAGNRHKVFVHYLTWLCTHVGFIGVGTGRCSSSGTPRQLQWPSEFGASPTVTCRYWGPTFLRCLLLQPCSPAGLLSLLTNKNYCIDKLCAASFSITASSRRRSGVM